MSLLPSRSQPLIEVRPMTSTRALPLLLAMTLTLACASRTDEDRPRAAEPPPHELAPEPGTKARAPVALALAAAGTHEALTLTLRVQATGDIPRAVSRFTLPEGVALVSGPLEQELGALARDEVRAVSIVVRTPRDGVPMIAAGVDCHLSRGVLLYGVAHLELTQPALTPGSSERVLDGDRIRGTPARPRP